MRLVLFPCSRRPSRQCAVWVAHRTWLRVRHIDLRNDICDWFGLGVERLNGSSAERNSCQDRQCDGVAGFHHLFLLLTSDDRQELNRSAPDPRTSLFASAGSEDDFETDGLSVLSPGPAAIRMPGIDSSACVQVASVETGSAGAGRRARERLPAAVRIGGINPSASVQAALVVILAA